LASRDGLGRVYMGLGGGEEGVLARCYIDLIRAAAPGGGGTRWMRTLRQCCREKQQRKG